MSLYSVVIHVYQPEGSKTAEGTFMDSMIPSLAPSSIGGKLLERRL